MAAHALLSPSAAHRWLHCTPSAVLESKIEDHGSSYAEEGTCAHALCERLVLDSLGRDTSAADKEFNELADKWYTPEMRDCAELYCDIVIGKWEAAQEADHLARIYVERRLDFSAYAPESFGTADCIILCNGSMEVIDFKYGRGVEVSAEQNPQMMIYALGAYDEFCLDYDIHEACMTIVQPRISNHSEWRIAKDELLAWATETLKPAAAAAYAGEGEQQPGDHCRFCSVKPTCAALALKAVDTWRQHREVRQLQYQDIGSVLTLVPMIEQWAEAVRERALAFALEGSTPAGYKLVEGRSVRVVTDPAALATALNAAEPDKCTEEAIYKPRELQTISALEKLVGKKRFAEIAEGYVEKPKGKPTLAPVTDKRQAISLSPAEEAAADFAHVSDEL